jgi:actin-like ATPase involved in cell morphogenesis
MAWFSKEIGIDLGTIMTRIADATQVLLEEPTIVALEVATEKMVAVGKEAGICMAVSITSRSHARCRTGSSPTTW